jgi:hypothetical protein
MTCWGPGSRYATFCELAGVDPTDAKAAQHPGIPPIDSISHWTAIATGQQTGRSSIVLSTPANLGSLGSLDETELGAEVAAAHGSGYEAKGSGDGAVIVWPHKLVVGHQRGMGVWCAPPDPCCNVSF